MNLPRRPRRATPLVSPLNWLPGATTPHPLARQAWPQRLFLRDFGGARQRQRRAWREAASASAPFSARANRGLAFPQPYGPWGFIGTALAAQYGFEAPVSDPAVSGGPPAAGTTGMPAAAQAAAGKCFNIVQAFNDGQFATSLAGIETLNNIISTDVITDPDLTKAASAWSACMARNGYAAETLGTIWRQQLTVLGPGGPAQGPPASPSAAQNQAQIAAAVTDAGCTLSSDLAGIYFAVQASYEQQLVTANQQALGAAVRDFKAACAKELSELPALLRTASATPNLPGPPGKPGEPGQPTKPGRPSPTRS
jgi:hypothetical protein